MTGILPDYPVLTIRIAPTLVTRALQGVRLALYVIVVGFAALDPAIAVLGMVALVAWSALADGAQS